MAPSVTKEGLPNVTFEHLSGANRDSHSAFKSVESKTRPCVLG